MWLLKLYGLYFAVLYVGMTAIFATLKVTRPLSIFGRIPWAEVVYGPALTCVSSYLLIAFGVWVECRIEDRRGKSQK